MAILLAVGAGAVAAVSAVTGISVGAYHFFKTTNKKILDINDLIEGDHIKFDKGLYPHHAVVVDVYVGKNSYKVIHFTGEKIFYSPAEIKEEIFKFEAGKIIRIRYRYGRLERGDAVERAYRLLRSQKTLTDDIMFDLLLNNCEHFATWCVTGKARSTQVNKALAPIAPITPIINSFGDSLRPY